MIVLSPLRLLAVLPAFPLGDSRKGCSCAGSAARPAGRRGPAAGGQPRVRRRHPAAAGRTGRCRRPLPARHRTPNCGRASRWKAGVWPRATKGADRQLRAWLGSSADAGHPGALEAMVSRGQDLATRIALRGTRCRRRGAACGAGVDRRGAPGHLRRAARRARRRPSPGCGWPRKPAGSSAAIRARRPLSQRQRPAPGQGPGGALADLRQRSGRPDPP